MENLCSIPRALVQEKKRGEVWERGKEVKRKKREKKGEEEEEVIKEGEKKKKSWKEKEGER